MCEMPRIMTAGRGRKQSGGNEKGRKVDGGAIMLIFNLFVANLVIILRANFTPTAGSAAKNFSVASSRIFETKGRLG